MRFGDDWLKEWVQPVPAPQELAHVLTMGGLEVDGIQPAAPPFHGVVVAQIVSIAAHPQADRLRVCQVDDGGAEVLQVVCGAANAAKSLRIPLARVGAALPTGLQIKAARLRGVESFGMLCSAQELGLAEASEGLLELPADAPVGMDLRAYLALDAHVLEVDLTPNRGDCLSVQGMARELAALTGAAFHEPNPVVVPVTSEAAVAITIADAKACPVYRGRMIENLNPQAPTPIWMRERLRRSGLRSLGPIVDVTNYVLLELGQPLHAFDMDRVEGGIGVRWAHPQETLTLLTGADITLAPDELVIADDQGPLALAGIMGGSRSAVGAQTHWVFLESACFAPQALAGRARRHGLHTEASHRYERGVDPNLQDRALARATQLLLEIAGGAAGPVVGYSEASSISSPLIPLRHQRLERLLGGPFAWEAAEVLLTRLNMTWQRTDQGWEATAPSYRFDLKIEADLIEELIRLRGYAALEAHAPTLALRPVTIPEMAVSPGKLRHLLVERGYYEAITYSFVDPEVQQAFLAGAVPIDLANPLSRDLSQMRTSLWPGLVQVLKANLKRQIERVRLFEMGKVFRREDARMVQENRLSGLVYGPRLPEQWRGETPVAADFFDVKGDVEALVMMARLPAMASVPAMHPALHPGKTAQLHVDGRPVGWLGELHPGVAAALDLPTGVIVFDWDLESTLQGNLPRFVPLSRFPAIRRDLALVVSDALPAGDLVGFIREAAGSRLRDCVPFDVYRGPGLEEGSKSVAFGLIFQDDERTLEDQEVDEAVAAIVRHVGIHAAARIRE
ncbi:MAG: phenylalanine--tRNA ligase subunit beta [Candidatus Macondimonas sp.]